MNKQQTTEQDQHKLGSHISGRDYVERIYQLLQERTVFSTDPLEIKTVLPHEVLEISRTQAKSKDEGGEDKSIIKKSIEEKKRFLSHLPENDEQVRAVRELLESAETQLEERNRAHYDDEISILEMAKKEDTFERLGLDRVAAERGTVNPINAQDSIHRLQQTINNIPEERRELYDSLIARLNEAIAAVTGGDGQVDPAKLTGEQDKWNATARSARQAEKKEADAYDDVKKSLNPIAQTALSILASSPSAQKYLDKEALEFFSDPDKVGILKQGLRRPLALFQAFGLPFDATDAEIRAKATSLAEVFTGIDTRFKGLSEVRNLDNFLLRAIQPLLDPESREQYKEKQVERTQAAFEAAAADPAAEYGLYRILGFDVPDPEDKDGLAEYKHRVPGLEQVKTAVEEALAYVQSDIARQMYSSDEIQKAENAIETASRSLVLDNNKSEYDKNMMVALSEDSDKVSATPGAKFIQRLFSAVNNSNLVKNWLAPMLNDPKSLVWLGYARSGTYGAIGLLSTAAGAYYLLGAGALIVGGGLAAGWGFPLLIGVALTWVPGIGFIQSASVAASKTVTQYARLFRNRYEDRISALVAMPVDPEKNMPYVRGFLDDLIEEGGYSVQQKADLREKLERLRRVYDNSADGDEKGRMTDTAEGAQILNEIETWLYENPLFSSYNYRNIYMGRDSKIVAKEKELQERLKNARGNLDQRFKDRMEAEEKTRPYRTMKTEEKAKLTEDEKLKFEEELQDYFAKVRAHDEVNGEISAITAEMRKQGAIFQNIAEVYRMAIATEEKLLKWRQFMRGGEIASYPELQTAFKTIAGDYQELLRYISEKKVAGPDGQERRLGPLSEQLAHINAPLMSMFGNAAPRLVNVPSYLRVPG